MEQQPYKLTGNEPTSISMETNVQQVKPLYR